MRKYLLPETGNFYKGNLHTHTNVSDGSMSPEDVKKMYKDAGYSVVAFTDHDIVAPQNHLTDDEFLAITGMENYINTPIIRRKDWDFNFMQTYHLCFLAKDPDNVVCPAFAEQYVERPHSLAYMTEDMKKYAYDREYSQAFVNKIIKEANEAGFLVTYNHPAWSLQNYKDYGELEGLWGVEVYNTAGARGFFPDNNQAFVDMIMEGKNVFPVAADDSHTLNSALGGHVWIKAEKLEYKTIMDALERGDFYASTGPEITELFVENECLFVKTKGAEAIYLNTECRFGSIVKGKDEVGFNLKDYLTVLRADDCQDPFRPFVRVTVRDKDGGMAQTRAYFLDEIGLL